MKPTDTMRALRAWQKRTGATYRAPTAEGHGWNQCTGEDIAGRQIFFNAEYRPRRATLAPARFQPCVPDLPLTAWGEDDLKMTMAHLNRWAG
jgi:hypothetical protein